MLDELKVQPAIDRGEHTFASHSPYMRTIISQAAKVARADISVLVSGESGTGKEVIARFIHQQSNRRSAPFVAINCAAIPETMLEATLFGHEKGAFTGASDRRMGKFEQADSGTLLLDEITEMPMALQAKILRVLQERELERIGSHQVKKIDVRIIATSNRDLKTAVSEGFMREDLFYRLSVFPIRLPRLIDRVEDLIPLAEGFLNKYAPNVPWELSPCAIQALKSHHWPGNIRELQNTIERAVILARNQTIEPTDIQLSTRTSSAMAGAAAGEAVKQENRDISLDRLEREHILSTLERTNWNKSMASQILGIERSTLDRKLKRYKVSRPSRSGRESG